MAETLRNTPVTAVYSPNVICLNQTMTINDSLQLLKANNILSAPVVKEEPRECIGSVDVLDLLSYVLSVPLDSPSWAVEVAARFRTPIYRGIDFSKKNPFLPVLNTTSLASAIVSNLSSTAHRAPVVNTNNTLVGVLSQFDVLEFVRLRMEEQSNKEWNDLGKKQIKEISYTTRVVSIPQSSTLLTAFEMISANRLSGIAVVDPTGSLIGNVSASDFKGVNETNFINMGIPLEQYITMKPLVVRPSESFLDAITIMSENCVHRVYIVTGNMVPIGVITLTDVMATLMTQLKL